MNHPAAPTQHKQAHLAQRLAWAWLLAMSLTGCQVDVSQPANRPRDGGTQGATGSAVATAPVVAAASPVGARGQDYFPNSEFTTDAGEKVRFFDDVLANKVVLVNFIYTSCGDSCPLETARLLKVQELLGDRMGKDIFFYSISIDPARDTPAALRDYKQRFHVGKGWTFLHGKLEDVLEIEKKLGVFREVADQRKDHTLDMMVGNQATGQWIKRSHLENAEVMASLLVSLHPEQPEAAQFKGYEEVPARGEQVDGAERLYVSRCLDCHSIGRGDGIGPDLAGVTQRRDRAWLKRWIKQPDVMLAAHDPLATAMYEQFDRVAMPNLQIAEADIDLLLDFIERQSKGAKAAR